MSSVYAIGDFDAGGRGNCVPDSPGRFRCDAVASDTDRTLNRARADICASSFFLRHHHAHARLDFDDSQAQRRDFRRTHTFTSPVPHVAWRRAGSALAVR